MSKLRIFIIDDEAFFVRITKDVLEEEGYLVATDTNPVEGLKKIRANPPDLILLDIRMAKMDGLQVCREIKNDAGLAHIPVIMMSVKAKESDVVVGLEMGADDYIAKPIRQQELAARVKTVLRRQKQSAGPKKVLIGALAIDNATYTAELNGEPLDLTAKEFELLSFFARNEGQVLTRARISEGVWGVEYAHSSRTIDFYVHQLRRKLKDAGVEISGLKGIGYRFEVKGKN